MDTRPGFVCLAAEHVVNPGDVEMPLGIFGAFFFYIFALGKQILPISRMKIRRKFGCTL